MAKRPTEKRARRAIEAFLADECPGYPDYSMCKDGDEGWAFWICPHDTTSYVHADLTIEWYGTGWPDTYSYDGDYGVWEKVTPN